MHIIEERTPAGMLDQLSLLAGEGDVVASLGRPPEHEAFSLPVRAVHCPLSVPQLGALRMRNLACGADLLHAWSARAAAAAAALGRRNGLPVLLSWPSLPEKKDLPFLTRLLGKGGVHLAVPTEVAQMALLWSGAREGSVHVLPPPARRFEDAQLAELRGLLRAALGVGDHQFLLVAPAEMVPGAGHKYASWVHAIVRQIVRDVLLMMPGGGPGSPGVRYFAGTTGYGQEVFFREDCPVELTGARLGQAVLAAGDVALFLAERDTGVAALAEAMSAGLAIAGSNTPDAAECAPDGAVALLSPACDARAASANVLRLVEDRRLAAELGAAARRRAAECFNVSAARGCLDEIYAASRS